VSKDRAAPFSRKHRRTWLPVTGGMILIGLINLAIGFWLWSDRPQPKGKAYAPPPIDAGVDAAPTPR
jgi:hypothetical protein